MTAFKIILATHNLGKVSEVQQIFNAFDFGENGIELISMASLNLAGAKETGNTYLQNALIKARSASKASGIAAIADDSGLEVASLDNKPGVFSARFAGPNASDEDNNRKLIRYLQGKTQLERTARYVCCAVYVSHAEDIEPTICYGNWTGQIVDEAMGENGFGYDPHFYLPTINKTVSQLPASEKNKLSHRGNAFQQLALRLREKLKFKVDC